MWATNLTPVGVKLFYSHCSLGVVPTVLQTKLLPLFHNRVVNMDCKLVGDVEHVAEFTSVRHVHRQNIRGAGYIHESDKNDVVGMIILKAILFQLDYVTLM